ncbi:uncharacterized protein EV420DRAFT_250755 [Desarmillaria tabescens]|uniref:Uncharacterized protein n=1 Tax=Armillaria tabescens TaxID=1929756 RepID=A0AA39N786_ARMTA|nr:uncharacterized protein EV420DRAFT_250755 [Desarmillaria tabescens]KAK0460098.1 hypothetical protein EV420DRAFT_250755 [Desarmillaria tabescens]
MDEAVPSQPILTVQVPVSLAPISQPEFINEQILAIVLSPMLRYRVRNVYLQCGHIINLPDKIIRCEESKCKFSLFHPANCKPPVCRRTCWQYLRYPEQYSMPCDSRSFHANTYDSPQHQRVLSLLLPGNAISGRKVYPRHY